MEEEVQEKAIIPQSPSPSWKIENVDGHLSELEKKVIRQMEHYFGDYNLPHDRFMNEVIGKNEGMFNLFPASIPMYKNIVLL